jgi:hypothetical protein
MKATQEKATTIVKKLPNPKPVINSGLVLGQISCEECVQDIIKQSIHIFSEGYMLSYNLEHLLASRPNGGVTIRKILRPK